MSEKITYGIKNVHIAKITRGTDGAITYAAPKALTGASEISLSTVGDAVKVYADDVVYYKNQVNQGYEGNLSVYAVPDWFYEDHLGCYKDTNDVLVEDTDTISADFALIFEFNTDTTQKKRTVLYNVSAGRPEISGKTKEEGIEAQVYSIPITVAPNEATGVVKASVLGDATNDTWSGWFTKVYTPAEA